MCRKLICLASLVLVLGLFLSGVTNAADPNLVGWWRLDENSGTTAYDSSGHGNDGTLRGGTQWQPGNGQVSGALEFNGSSGYVEIPFSESLRGINQGDFAITAWSKLHLAWLRDVPHVKHLPHPGHRVTEVAGDASTRCRIELAAVGGRQQPGTRCNRGMTGAAQRVGGAVGLLMSQEIVRSIPLVFPGIGMHGLRPFIVDITMAGRANLWIFKSSGFEQ